MISYEIFWDDLNAKAKKKLKGLWHENIDLSPIAIIDQEEIINLVITDDDGNEIEGY